MRKLISRAALSVGLLMTGCQSPIWRYSLFPNKDSQTATRPATPPANTQTAGATPPAVNTRPVPMTPSNPPPVPGIIQQTSATRPDSPPQNTVEDRLDYDMQRATDAFRTKRYTEARLALEGILLREPQNLPANHLLAQVSDCQQRWSDAEQHYLNALSQRPEDPNILSDLGYSYLLQGRYDEAKEKLLRANYKDPKHRQSLLNLGAVHAAMGDSRAALFYFRKVVPDDQANQLLSAELERSITRAKKMVRNQAAPSTDLRGVTQDDLRREMARIREESNIAQERLAYLQSQQESLDQQIRSQATQRLQQEYGSGQIPNWKNKINGVPEHQLNARMEEAGRGAAEWGNGMSDQQLRPAGASVPNRDNGRRNNESNPATGNPWNAMPGQGLPSNGNGNINNFPNQNGFAPNGNWGNNNGMNGGATSGFNGGNNGIDDFNFNGARPNTQMPNGVPNYNNFNPQSGFLGPNMNQAFPSGANHSSLGFDPGFMGGHSPGNNFNGMFNQSMNSNVGPNGSINQSLPSTGFIPNSGFGPNGDPFNGSMNSGLMGGNPNSNFGMMGGNPNAMFGQDPMSLPNSGQAFGPNGMANSLSSNGLSPSNPGPWNPNQRQSFADGFGNGMSNGGASFPNGNPTGPNASGIQQSGGTLNNPADPGVRQLMEATQLGMGAGPGSLFNLTPGGGSSLSGSGIPAGTPTLGTPPLSGSNSAVNIDPNRFRPMPNWGAQR